MDLEKMTVDITVPVRTLKILSEFLTEKLTKIPVYTKSCRNFVKFFTRIILCCI